MTKYLGSETSRAEVSIYSHGETLLPSNVSVSGDFEGKKIQFTQETGGRGLVSCSTSKTMGAASGTFMFQIKQALGSDDDLRNYVRDDDWVDIVFKRHNRPFHVMRGLIDDVRRNASVNASGASVVTYTVTGRDFGKIFEQTALWFDRVTKGDWCAAAATRIWSEHNGLANGPVNETVKNFLLGFLIPSNNAANGLWAYPSAIPRTGKFADSGGSFYTSLFVHEDDFSNVPARTSAINPTLFSTSSPNIWSLAQEWSDPMLCELYVDLIRGNAALGGRYLTEDESCTPNTTRMAAIIRDRPFPNSTRDADLHASPYFTKIPLFTVPREAVFQSDVGRSGRERKNSFFFSSRLLQELAKGYIDMQLPLVNRSDIDKHGMRRMDAESRYISDTAADGSDYALMAKSYRSIVRDIHCLNHLFLNGVVTLNHSRPDIRIGGRLRISEQNPADDETYYIEGVRHTWDYERGSRTSLDLTRGFVGTDDNYVSTLQTVQNEYGIGAPNSDEPLILAGQPSNGELSPSTSSTVSTLV